MNTSKFELYKDKIRELSSIATDIFNSIIPNETYLHIVNANGDEEFYIKVCVKIPVKSNKTMYDIAVEGPAISFNLNAHHEKINAMIYKSIRRGDILTSATADPDDDPFVEIVTQQDFENAGIEAANILK